LGSSPGRITAEKDRNRNVGAGCLGLLLTSTSSSELDGATAAPHEARLLPRRRQTVGDVVGQENGDGDAINHSSPSWRLRMRIAAIGVLVATLGVAACNDTDPAFAPSALNGPFVLQSVNGAAVPAVVIDSANPPLRLDALSGTITVMRNNAFTDVTRFRQTLNGVISTRTVTCTGSYAAVGNVFQFVETTSTPQCGFTFTGVISGNTLSASVLGVSAVFSQ
jgi:hypothetical protein